MALTAQPLGPTEGLNWIFLVELLICGILALFFLFYFNRLFATVVSYGIRAWTWHKYRAYIDISALQISLLGGRVFFKSARYHAHNITVLVHDGHITWRYWLRQVQEAQIFDDSRLSKERKARASTASPDAKEKQSDTGEKYDSRSRSAGRAEAGGKTTKELPCRISVKVSGVEAFVYNRSPVYDSIIEATLKKTQESPGSSGKDTENSDPPASSDQTKDFFGEKAGSTSAEAFADALSKSNTGTEQAQTPVDPPSWLRMLPIRIACRRAAAAVGNENTTSILTAKVDQSSGTIDAGSSGPLDLYKLLFAFDFKKVDVAMKPNRDFKRLQSEAAHQVVRDQTLHPHRVKKTSSPFLHHLNHRWQRLASPFARSRKHMGSVRTASPKSDASRSSTAFPEKAPGQAQWQGLTRYLDEDTPDDREDWRGIEYAKASTLADCEQVSMRFYWDIPGQVRDQGERPVQFEGPTMTVKDIPPPEYGLDLAVHGGFVVYGPWADRQRINLQRVFFPAGYVDAIPRKPSQAGETREATIFKLFLSIEKDVTLRIPTREASKDSRWKGRASRTYPGGGPGNAGHDDSRSGKRQKNPKRRKGRQNDTGADARPYGWLDITIKEDSTISYAMDMYAREIGYRNLLEIDVKGTEMTSSVNHALLWRAGALSLGADLSNPLSWNSLRDWPFKITCDDLELFILRDHMFLIIDLVNDWSSGPPPEFYTFVPFRYQLELTFRNFVLYLNTNDANIVNDPADFDKNEFLTLEGRSLDSVLGIPMQQFRPKKNEITFDVLAQGLSMRMLNSPRNTLKTLLQEKRVAELPKLTLNGSYCSNQEQTTGLTDTLRMDIVGIGLSMQAYGFFVRHLINVKENYFGDYIHFKTLEEFQNAGDDMFESNAKTVSLPKPKSINELDVLLSIAAKNSTVMLPTNLYSATEFIRADLPDAVVDLRTSSYYLDLAINFSPISVQLGSSSADERSPSSSASETQLYVSHASVSGHRAFGLPPDEPSYAANWEIDVGPITGECSKRFLHDGALAVKALLFTFKDRENALPLASPQVIYDATFVQVKTDLLRVWLHVGDEALLLSADPMTVHSSDWADETFSQRVNVLVPNFTLACVDGKSAARHRVRENRKRPVRTYAFLQSSVNLTVVERKKNFTEEALKQQLHIRRNDMRTSRTAFLLRRDERWQTVISGDTEISDVDSPAMPSPPFPFPLQREGHTSSRPASVESIAKYTHGRALRNRQSSASLASSVRGGRPKAPGAFNLRPAWSSNPSSQDSDSNAQGSSVESVSKRHAILPDDQERAQFGLPPSTMAFSSTYMEPYFPLDVVRPDEDGVPGFLGSDAGLHSSSETSSMSSLMDDELAEENSSQTTIMLRFEPGIRAYVEPRIGRVVAKLLEALHPKTAEDVLDNFQVCVMSAIGSQQKERHTEGEVMQIGLDIPSVNFRISNADDENRPWDVIDVSARAIAFSTRIRKIPEEVGHKDSVSLHAMVGMLTASLHEAPDDPKATVAARLTFEDILLWVALSASRTIRVTVGSTSLLATTSKAIYLTAFVGRILALVSDNQPRFIGPKDTDRKRLHLLLYTLTQLGEHIGDPPFMTRMTYVLRAFPDHYRNQESWKILMRFRNVLQSMPTSLAKEVEDQFSGKNISCPENAPHRILESWTQWRNWDVVDIVHTVVFQKILESQENESTEEPPSAPLSMTWVQETLKIAMTDGFEESSITMGNASLGMDLTPRSKPTGLMLLEENKRTKTLLHLHSAFVSLDLHWNLVDAADKLMPRILELTSSNASSETRRGSTSQALNDGLNRHDLHVVLSTEDASFALHSINLRHLARAEGLRMSLIGTTQADETYGKCASVLVNADLAGTQLYGQSKCIWQTLLTSPSIYLDHLQPADDLDLPPTITAAIAYNECQLSVQEQLHGILHVVDAVISDEVAQVLRLVRSIPAEANELPDRDSSRNPGTSAKSAKIHVALLAGELLVELSLLQSLKYRLEGRATSVRVAPSLSESKHIAIDFETGQLSHSFVNTYGAEEHQQGILKVPPINGQLALQLEERERRVSVGMTIGQVEVDAEALQGVASVVNTPEVQDIISAVKDGAEQIQQRVKGLAPSFQQRETAKVKPEVSLLYYEIRLALQGVRVAASTPHANGRSTAELKLGIGPVHTIASNHKSAATQDMPLVPEVRGSVKDIGASLVVRDAQRKQHAGSVVLTIVFHLSVEKGQDGRLVRELSVVSPVFEIKAQPDTAAIIVDVINHLQNRLKHLDLSREMEYVRHLRDRRKRNMGQEQPSVENNEGTETSTFSAADLLAMKLKLELKQMEVRWLVDESHAANRSLATEDLVLTTGPIELTTRRGNEGRLTMKQLQLQLVPRRKTKYERTLNSALLPEIVFSVRYWSHGHDRSLAFKASGKPLDLRLESRFIVPVNGVQRSITYAVEGFKTGTANWRSTALSSGLPRTPVLSKAHFASIVAEADFAGAQVYVQAAGQTDAGLTPIPTVSQTKGHQHGRYGQFASDEGVMHTTLRTPGIALKLQFDTSDHQSRVSGELMVASSSNMLLPHVVPLALEISNSVKEVMQDQEDNTVPTVSEPAKGDSKMPPRFFEDESIVAADPSAIFGKTKVNLGLRVSRQEFGLTCQPIAKVDAKAELEDLYFTVSTIDADEHGHFFAMSATLTNLTAKVKHVYSREPTFSYEMESIVLSLMNSKHFSGVNGISAILKINPTKTSINGKQLQDLLLFREIWLPPEIRNAAAAEPAPQASHGEEYLVQKYQTVAAAAAFPWNATVSIAELGVDLDLGQSIGKTSFKITNLWASSQKSSNWEQNLCIGLDDMATTSQGRMSGFIQLHRLGVRTLIRWPEDAKAARKTPLIQASIGFQRMRAKAAFEYQAFAFGDIEGFDFLMYNVREQHGGSDRLVAVLDCEKAYVFCTSTSPAQAFSLYQAVERLIQEKEAAFAQSLKDIESHLRRQSTAVPSRLGQQVGKSRTQAERSESEASITLRTDVVVTLGNISVGAFPSTFFDSQILKLEASNIQARFAVGWEKGKTRSGLGMTLGQLHVALAPVKKVIVPKTLSEISVDEIITSAVDAKGGIILRVPKVIASMDTWQAPRSNDIEYIFKSLFAGKVDIGWNLNRINFIRGMWITHSRALAGRLGKPLPESALKISAGLQRNDGDGKQAKDDERQQEKITAEVNLPQSRYEYKALEPPIIETPQLRDMGEATPPLEWIGLHRDRLPHVTHQIIIVSLLEVAKEVEDAYERILGSS